MRLLGSCSGLSADGTTAGCAEVRGEVVSANMGENVSGASISAAETSALYFLVLD